ncbi:MAG: ATP-binding cassette domain-containing protein [Bacteroidetes bacterium]|nr:ATP-binding cassette domain-containing protein [Bacteroidota bacterium]MBL0097965.1 ATP-binding cassette domain-containing protein [Bacteroidota bacterium]
MKNYFRLLRYIGPYKSRAITSVTFNILTVVFSLFSLTMIVPFLNVLFSQDRNYTLQPWTFSVKTLLNNFNYYLGDFVVRHGQLEALSLISLLVVILFLLKNFTRYMAMYYLVPIRNGVVRDIRRDVYSKILSLPIGYFTDERKGDIMARVTNDVQEVEWGIMNSLEAAFREPLNIIIFLITMFTMSSELTLFVLVLLPIAGLIIGRIGKSLKKKSGLAQIKVGELLSNLDESLGGLRIIHAFTAEEKSKKRFGDINQQLFRLLNKIGRRRDLASPLSEFLGALVLTIVMYFGGRLVLGPGSSLEPSEFIAFIAIFSQLIPPAKSLTTAWYNIQKGLASSERIYHILDAPVAVKDAEHPKDIATFTNVVSYRNVSFSYRKGEPDNVLKNISLDIPFGKTIALVGQSGSGKTTLADMLPRYYDPAEGQILLDGHDLRELRIHDLRKLIGVVTQESILFNDTVFNNIAFGVDNATEEAVINAAKVANAHDFISAMPDGYHSNIGDRGGKLSGGQRQRLSIARAVLKNPPILILDEATSALDTESERLVQDALTHLMQNRTTLVIAHRLSTIVHANEIIVMNKGEIVERGTHVALLELGGYYKRLYELQTFQ